jgi:putative spermidine/putrescine transport system ATP-binding protein
MTDVTSAPATSPPASPTPASPSPLELVGVGKRYGTVVAVDDVSLRLDGGEFLTFLGQSGSGKTTVLKMVAGFERCDRGTIRIGGLDVAAKPPRDRGVGMVFQQYALFPHLTVAENIAYGLRRHKWQPERRRRRVDEMLDLVRLGELARRYPRQLSGGQQQRVAVARALAFEPRLLLMDEPLGALDRALRLDLEHELRRIHRSTGCSVVYVTHDRDEALALSDRIAVFHAGRLVGLDRPERLYAEPPTSYVARLLTDANLIPLPAGARRSGTHVETRIGGRPVRLRAAAEVGDRARISVPRAAIRMSVPSNEEEHSVPLPAVVEDVVFLGEHAKVELRSDALGPLVAQVPLPVRCSSGDAVTVHLDLDRCTVVVGE